MSLRIAPPSSHPTSTNPSAQPSAPSAPGLPDTLRTSDPSTTYTNSSSASTQPQSSHPLETRLAHWPATQTALKHTLLRRQFGIAAPTVRAMELRIVAEGDGGRPSCLGRGAGVHGDVLAGSDWSVEWEDVFVGDEMRNLPDFHAEMEMRLGMNW